MNKTLHTLLFLATLLVTVTTGVASAQNKAETFNLTPFIGGYVFDGKQHLEHRPTFGLRGGYNFTDRIGVEGVFGFVNTEPTEGHSTGNDDMDVFNYRLEALYHFFPESRLVPYLAAGYGVIATDRDNSKRDTRGAFNYGLGAKYFLTDNLALRGDVRHLISNNVPDPTNNSRSYTRNNLEYTVGIGYFFGGAKPAPAPVVAPQPAPVAQPAPPQEPPLEPPPAKEPMPGLYKYCITLAIEFDIDKDLIRPAYHDEVAKVGKFMKQYPTTTAVIEGHTDNVGTVEHNMDLSKRRAESVVNYLVEKFGIDRSRLSAKGYGPNKPIADNATDAGRQQNRRIEAIIDCAFDVKEIKPPEQLCVALLVEFDTGKADIKPQFRDEIAKVGDYMKKYPTTTAIIEGHTDNVGGSDYNMKLSLQRAENVVSYLVDNFGIDRSRLSAKGYGFTRRIAYNNTPEGRQKNRRINAIIDCVIKK